MGIQDFLDKTKDCLTSAKLAFEKDCTDFTCISLSYPLITKEIKAKLDKTNKTISLSCNLSDLASIPKPYVFVNSSNTIVALEEGSDQFETFILQGKTKELTYVYTTANIYYVSLDTKRI